MIVRKRHFFLALGYDPSMDVDHTITLCLFGRDAPRGHRQYRFLLYFGIDIPRFHRIYGEAGWVSKRYEICGWHWPVWFQIAIRSKFVYWHTKPHTWRPKSLRGPVAEARRRENARRQKDLNSAMVTARMQDPRAPDWLIRARAQNIAGI